MAWTGQGKRSFIQKVYDRPFLGFREGCRKSPPFEGGLPASFASRRGGYERLWPERNHPALRAAPPSKGGDFANSGLPFVKVKSGAKIPR